MVSERIKDSVALWQIGRFEGCLIMILVSVAATAKKRYPRTGFSDSESFKKYILDEMGKITGGPTSGVKFYYNTSYNIPLEKFLYNILRCELLHEGTMPVELKFSEPVVENGKIFNVLRLYDPIEFPIGWIWNLARAVMESPENNFENFDGVRLPPNYLRDAGLKLEFPDDDFDRTGINN
jgi:hypothetical protein